LISKVLLLLVLLLVVLLVRLLMLVLTLSHPLLDTSKAAQRCTVKVQ